MCSPPTKAHSNALLVYALAAALVFAYLLLRAAVVPLVHDEANTFFHYVHNGTWVPFLGHWDAGNHVLAMAMDNLSTALWGPCALSLRSFALLSFLLHAVYTWHLGRLVHDPLVRWCLWAAMLATPFVLEFFALFRGYGPSVALLVMGTCHLARTWHSPRALHAWLAPLAFGLGVTANLSLLPMWAMAMGLLLIPVLRGEGPLGARLGGLLLGTLPGLGMTAFAFGLRDRDLLYHGNTQGVLGGSLATLSEVVFGSAHHLLLGTIAAAFVMLVVATLPQLRREHRTMATLVPAMALLLLGGELLARVVLGQLLHVLYPTYRAVLHWVPLFLLAVAFTVDQRATVHRAWRWAALLLVVFPLRTVLMANLRTVTNWKVEALPVAVMAQALALQEEAQRTLALGIPVALSPIWDHALLMRGGTALLATVGANRTPGPTCIWAPPGSCRTAAGRCWQPRRAAPTCSWGAWSACPGDRWPAAHGGRPWTAQSSGP